MCVCVCGGGGGGGGGDGGGGGGGLGSVRCVWLDKIPDLFLCYVLLVCYCSLYLSLESFKYELSRDTMD